MTPKSECVFCELIKDPGLLIKEQGEIAVIAHPQPASEGHILVLPKEHIPIIEMVPDKTIEKLFVAANDMSIKLFDRLKAQGTNIIVQNGIPAGQTVAHFGVHVIPRAQGDSLSFLWKPKQLTEEEMSTIELRLKEEAKAAGSFEEDEQEAVEVKKPEPEEEIPEEDPRARQMRRAPRW